MDPIEQFLSACVFAADKHKFQRRKGCLKIPYINHPLKVSKILKDAGENDIDLLLAAILHDTLEDTDATDNEINQLFGEKVLNIVKEVTDDMSLPSKTRKELQIEKAPHISKEAQLIKIADKISNISDLINYPIHWEISRKIEYVEWSVKVFEKCEGSNPKLDQLFKQTAKAALDAFKG